MVTNRHCYAVRFVFMNKIDGPRTVLNYDLKCLEGVYTALSLCILRVTSGGGSQSQKRGFLLLSMVGADSADPSEYPLLHDRRLHEA